ncbi:zinc ribbon domain-containing protein [Rhodococcus tibetensis]|uniref:C4-type zinc ribbon domain-containing protein n=1 Tax=Rhodococcus tibetensis TaxID=2965064 RepID=A0ABT1QCV5_9NOCA|nr:C4-type zinc ribbon domain-containing protein [Rhodococcus sp. FXJ9.536]MCQ4118960.1 C4-type zinc ribbon domain-containing protein [Rhodococcus sp. FXJ9.536]
MNVEPQVQSKLLDLAGVDAELSRITYRRTALPEQQEVERLEAERLTRKDAAVAVEIILDDLDRDIRKLEGEVDAVRKREDRDRALLQSGSVGSKQLTELEHELGSLVRRQGLLEDELLEVMERREASQSDHDHAGAQLSQIEDELIDARRRRDDAVADLDSAEQRCNADRIALAEQLPADLVAVYEKQRSQNSVGAALLQARRCGACRIELDRGEISRITATAPDIVVRCPECGAILVRTKESGL